jgi:hypothetical protein
MNKRRAMAIDRRELQKESARYFEAFKRLQGEDGRELVADENSTPPDAELLACLNAIPKAQPKKRKKRPENVVLKACLELLVALHIFSWRNNSGAVQIGERFLRYGLKGSADILGVLPSGRFLAIECKAPGGVQSPNQKWFQQKIEINGGVYLLVESAAELADKLKGLI